MSDEETHDTHILHSAIETVYERPETHGEPEDSFGLIADLWGDFLDIELEDWEVANMFVLMKVARNREGIYHEDNYEDIAGYAENGARLHPRPGLGELFGDQ